MKKLFLLAALALPLSVSLTACNSTTTIADDQAYTVSINPFAYTYANAVGTPVVSTVVVTAAAGAPDATQITYTAVLLNSKGAPATGSSSILAPAMGTLINGAKGGYTCTTSPSTNTPGVCVYSSSNAIFTTNSTWANNTIAEQLIPAQWATAAGLASTNSSDTAQWFAQFTFTAYGSNGKTYTWKQNYPLLLQSNT